MQLPTPTPIPTDPNYVLFDRQGTRYTFNPVNNHPSSLAQIEDTNGNLIGESLDQTTWTDTLGRSIPDPVNGSVRTTDYTGCTGSLPTSGASLWSPPGPNGGTLQFKFCVASFPLSFNPP